jgi:hypothetical protein
MRKVLLASAFLAAISATPASATLQIALQVGPDSFFCADNNPACDTDPVIGTIQVADRTVDGITVDGSVQTSIHGVEFPTLSTASLSITNTLATLVVATVAVSDTDYAAVATRFVSSAGGTWVGPGGATTTQGFFVDPNNAQGAATAFDTPGTLIDTFSAASSPLTESFSHNGSTIMTLTSPFSLTEQATFVLPPGEQLLNRGQALVGIVVPEPSTWAMLLIGLVAMAAPTVMRKRRRESLE